MITIYYDENHNIIKLRQPYTESQAAIVSTLGNIADKKAETRAGWLILESPTVRVSMDSLQMPRNPPGLSNE
jgi:hypothetical protein